jgi:hypothetical protein
MSGYSGTPLPRKLGIRPNARLYLEGAPADYHRLVAPLPAGVQFVPRIDAATDLVHLFATRRALLERALSAARRTMRPDAVIWISWPKKTAALKSDVSEDVIRELALPLGLVDIKVCAIDDTWSGLKLMLRRSERPEATPRATRRRTTR